MNNRVVGLLLLFTALSAISGEPDPAEALKRLQDAYAWERKTSVDDYKTFGNRDPRWDKDVIDTLEFMSKILSGTAEGLPQMQFKYFKSSETGMSKGCYDPLFQYAYLRSNPGLMGSPIQCYKMALQAARDIRTSRYHIYRKATTEVILAKMVMSILEFERRPEHMTEYQTAIENARNTFQKCLLDKEIPSTRIVDLGIGILSAQEGVADPEQFLTWLLDGLTKEQRVSPPVLVITTRAYISYAWDARGLGYANSVTEDGRLKMEKRLKIAANCAEQAFSADPYIRVTPREMLAVELGQGEGMERLNLWFKRGVTINPNDSKLHEDYMYYLEPKWRGSEKQMLDFARAIAAEKNWKNGTPLLVELAHRRISKYENSDEQEAYFKRPGVWPELKNCFESYLAVYPDATTTRTQFMRLAAFAGQWEVAKEQRKTLGGNVAKDTFEVPAEFRRVLAEIDRH